MAATASTDARGVHASGCMVATGHPLASQAARTMLEAGGSAIDAAIAADAVLGVVEPMATGIGGDMLAMVVPVDAEPLSYNGTGRAPAALEPSLVDALPNGRIGERHPYAVTVPGAVRGWHDMHGRFGRLPWASLFAPAIAAARSGFAVAPVCAREWALFAKVLMRDAHSAALYRAAEPPRAGEVFANPELAQVLQAIASDGPDAFYLGAPARAAAQQVQALGGVLTEADFAAHDGLFCTPASTRFRGLTVLECPPNTHGVAVLRALDTLEAQPLDPADPRTTLQAVQAMGEAMRWAQKTVADPAGNTVCTVVVDRDGLAVTLMTSVFKRFGSGIAAPGCGFVLQNRGFGFSGTGHINGPAPRKRPYHTVVPGAALREGRFHAAFGVVGGAMQPQGQLQLMLRVAAFGEPLQAALDAPRWRLESDTALAIEAGYDPAVAAVLRGAGYTDPLGQGELGGRSDFGGAQWVMRAPDGGLVGASDKRKDGLAWGA
ncbi:gamma-glutamyltransferase family protein [Xylophilus sp. GOD-11R]|uniref:gamma-glutamyltransferase family protein n=1 Tax=Xylophilus sp. GOD-11R TaxID=3089814 RepID=UPI00298D06F7|nr:gamma-glutamyltransferase [Xylophilus sp. GOD-11R]WPB56415.1 gamma-glutamyltransferase [Xylophilus sp. GOD-11R]